MTQIRHFDYEHLPEGRMRNTSKQFHDLARELDESVDPSDDFAEFHAGLRKLLEAKDCFVRSVIPR